MMGYLLCFQLQATFRLDVIGRKINEFSTLSLVYSDLNFGAKLVYSSVATYFSPAWFRFCFGK